MYMEVFHVYGSFASIYMEVFYVYGEYVHVYGGFFFRMEFPEFVMICPIQGCPASSFYRKFDHLKRHWYNIHVPEITMHHCSYYKKDFVERRHAKSHLKTHRTFGSSETKETV